MAIAASGVFGGHGSTHTRQPTIFPVGNSTNSSVGLLTLSQNPPRFWVWWSAGHQFNRVDLYQGSTLFATFSTQDLLTFLNKRSRDRHAAVEPRIRGALFGNPNIASGNRDAAEPFVYVSFAIPSDDR